MSRLTILAIAAVTAAASTARAERRQNVLDEQPEKIDALKLALILVLLR